MRDAGGLGVGDGAGVGSGVVLNIREDWAVVCRWIAWGLERKRGIEDAEVFSPNNLKGPKETLQEEIWV